MTISELIERLEKAEGAELRYIDCHLWVIGQGGDARMRVCDSSTKDFVWERGVDGMWVRSIANFREVPRYTASIDAATRFCELVLPGYGWDIASNTSHIKACLNPEFGAPIGKHPHWAAVSNISSKKFEDGATPAIALCIAILRALQPKEGE